VALLCMLPWAIKQGKAGLTRGRRRLYSLRAVLEYGAYCLSVYSLSFIGDAFTLPMHAALNFVTPILAVIASIIILRESSRWYTWVAVALGVVGVLVITRPGIIPASPGVFYVLGAAAAFSLCGPVIKLLSSSETPQHIAFFMLLMTSILAIPMGILHWQWPSAEGWMWLAAIGILSYAAQILVGKAISKVPYMVLIPLNFGALIFSTILSYLVFAKLVDVLTVVGAIIILGGVLFNAWMSTREGKKPAPNLKEALQELE
jgi:drug/metabolite transporter (DMT)-like permease